MQGPSTSFLEPKTNFSTEEMLKAAHGRLWKMDVPTQTNNPTNALQVELEENN